MSKKTNGYWILDELNKVVEKELYKNVSNDEVQVGWLSKSIPELSFLKHQSIRALILAFISDFSTVDERESVLKKTIIDEIIDKGLDAESTKKAKQNQREKWKNVIGQGKNNFARVQFTPTILYIYARFIKRIPSLAQFLVQSVEKGIVSHKLIKGESVSQKQNYWLTSIISFNH